MQPNRYGSALPSHCNTIFFDFFVFECLTFKKNQISLKILLMNFSSVVFTFKLVNVRYFVILGIHDSYLHGFFPFDVAKLRMKFKLCKYFNIC